MRLRPAACQNMYGPCYMLSMSYIHVCCTSDVVLVHDSVLDSWMVMTDDVAPYIGLLCSRPPRDEDCNRIPLPTLYEQTT